MLVVQVLRTARTALSASVHTGIHIPVYTHYRWSARMCKTNVLLSSFWYAEVASMPLSIGVDTLLSVCGGVCCICAATNHVVGARVCFRGNLADCEPLEQCSEFREDGKSFLSSLDHSRRRRRSHPYSPWTAALRRVSRRQEGRIFPRGLFT